eukprot:2926866-Rhodomonas_salina.1
MCCKVRQPLLSRSWTGMSQLQLSPSAYDSSPPPAPRKCRRSRANDSRSGSAGDSAVCPEFRQQKNIQEHCGDLNAQAADVHGICMKQQNELIASDLCYKLTQLSSLVSLISKDLGDIEKEYWESTPV